MTTNEDLDLLRLAAEDAAGGPPSVEQVDTLIDLVDALEARLADALEARQPGGIDRDVAIDAIAGGTISVPGGYGVLHGDDAANIVDAIIGRAAVPDAATEARIERWMQLVGKGVEERMAAEAERDAALAAIERVRSIDTGNNRALYGNDFEAGMAKALWLVKTALDGAPEPEWEEHINYGAERTDGSVAYEPRGRNYATHQQVARFGPWDPVGGEKP